MNIEDLGFTKEELQERVIDRICEQLLTGISSDDEGNECSTTSAFHRKIQERIQKRIDDTINAIAEKHVLPRVTEMIETITLQKTNEWGEKKASPMSFIEYLLSRAETYMQEKVDHNGKGKNDADNYGWTAKQTRITYLVEHHLHYSIETAMKGALIDVNSQIAKGLYETCRLKINEIAQGFKISFNGGK